MASTLTPEQIAASNNRLVDMYSNGQTKQANAVLDDYVRKQMREEGILRRYLPPQSVGREDLDRQSDTDLPVIVCEREPDNPASVTVGFGTWPDEYEILGDRFRMTFARTLSPRYIRDVETLLTHNTDIRQLISDNSMKDTMAEEDSNWFAAMNRLVIGVNTAVPYAGNSVLWRSSSGGITRDTYINARTTMPNASGRFNAAVGIINQVTAFEFMTWGYDEMGGDTSQDVLKNGISERLFGDLRLIVTIKNDLVPNNRMYMLADPRAVMKHAELTPITLYTKADAFMIEWFNYQTTSFAFGNATGVAVHTFE